MWLAAVPAVIVLASAGHQTSPGDIVDEGRLPALRQPRLQRLLQVVSHACHKCLVGLAKLNCNRQDPRHSRRELAAEVRVANAKPHVLWQLELAVGFGAVKLRAKHPRPSANQGLLQGFPEHSLCGQGLPPAEFQRRDRVEVVLHDKLLGNDQRSGQTTEVPEGGLRRDIDSRLILLAQFGDVHWPHQLQTGVLVWVAGHGPDVL
mmetsp:Transcript_17506/g.41199  ORF Transcript_17506/g.41199 Transcript_17506/m.41199 type:complete len:205 (+) Transcript_17506:2433-3047(+)